VGRVGASVVLAVVSIVLFVLAALGVTIGSAGELDLIAWGLAALVLGSIMP
jgi:hypothetical protein